MNDVQQASPLAGRLSVVFLIGVITVATVGYFVGINDGVPGELPRESYTNERRSDDTRSSAESEGVKPDLTLAAMAYSEMRRSGNGPTSQWKSTLDQIGQPQFDLFEEFVPSPEEKQASLLVRASRRAFNGAPPIIPHSVERTDDAACFACHGQGIRIDHKIANQMCHPFLANCTQCHAPPAPKPFERIDASVETTFVGLPTPLQGERAYPGAPPTIPHSSWMRDNCLSCHGREAGWAGMESTHPWRASCQQCHAPSASLNQAITANPIPMLSELPIEAP